MCVGFAVGVRGRHDVLNHSGIVRVLVQVELIVHRGPEGQKRHLCVARPYLKLAGEFGGKRQLFVEITESLAARPVQHKDYVHWLIRTCWEQNYQHGIFCRITLPNTYVDVDSVFVLHNTSPYSKVHQ